MKKNNKSQIKEQVVNITFNPFTVPKEKLLKDVFKLDDKNFKGDDKNKINNNTQSKILPFFYVEMNDDGALSYLENLREQVKYALNIPEYLEMLQLTIDSMNYDTEDKKYSSLLYKKMEKLKVIYNRLVTTTLGLCHDLYWKLFPVLSRGKLPNQVMKEILPIVLEMKHAFEKQVELEFPTDVVSKLVQQNILKVK